MTLLYIEPFEIGQGFFRRSGEKQVRFEDSFLGEIKTALFRKLGRCPGLLTFFAYDPYVDSYLTSKQAQKIVDYLKADIEEDSKYEIFLPFIHFLEENAEGGGFFVFFSI